MVAPAGAVGVTAATAMAVMEVAVMQAAVAAMPAAVAAMPAAHAVMPVAHAATVVEHAADTAAAMRAVVHADTAAAVHAAALAVVMAAALAAADMRVVAAATAAADIGNSCGFSQKGPPASAGGPFRWLADRIMGIGRRPPMPHHGNAAPSFQMRTQSISI